MKTYERNYKAKIISGMACVVAGCMLLSAQAAASTDFSDVPSSHWAYDYISAAADNHYVSGLGNNTFAPNQKVTYAEFAVMLTNAFCPDKSKEFPSYQNMKWYYPYMYAIDKSGYVDNTSLDYRYEPLWDQFANEPINRYNVAMMAYNLLNINNAISDADTSKASSELADWNRIKNDSFKNDVQNRDYETAVAVCYNMGIISGYEDKQFHGRETLTRAQACAILIRLDEIVNDKNYDFDTEASVTPVPEPEAKPETSTNVSNGSSVFTEEYIAGKFAELKAKYPQWSNWDEQGQIYNSSMHGGCYSKMYVINGMPITIDNMDCAAWAWYASDYIFGNAPVTTHTDYYAIKPGDVLKLGGGTHWAIVTKKIIKDNGQVGYQVTDSGSSHDILWDDEQPVNGATYTSINEYDYIGEDAGCVMEVYTRY